MRLDKMLSECGIASRTETAKACRAGNVTVNGQTVRNADHPVDPDSDQVVFGGHPVTYRRFLYVMLNKPDGYVSATEDGKSPVVTELLPPEYRRAGLFPCGRLDKHTLGLMLLTNDGVLCHRLLTPKNHVAKTYRFRVKFPLSEEDIRKLESGVDIGGYLTKPCTVHTDDPKNGTVTISEGKYHQIKLMMEAVHNQVTELERITFGSLRLDPSLERGAWRLLTSEEENSIRKEAERTVGTASERK